MEISNAYKMKLNCLGSSRVTKLLFVQYFSRNRDNYLMLLYFQRKTVRERSCLSKLDKKNTQYNVRKKKEIFKREVTNPTFKTCNSFQAERILLRNRIRENSFFASSNNLIGFSRLLQNNGEKRIV